VRLCVVPRCGRRVDRGQSRCREHLKLRQRNGWADQAIRRQVKDRDGHRCVRCGSTRGLEVHHLGAGAAGGQEAASDRVTLCGDCHAAETARQRARPPVF
jgi:5-methylcytosine-specific restriction endonuclease McrA